MISVEDIEGMSALKRVEIDALAERELLTTHDAALMGNNLMQVHYGPQKVHEMICDHTGTTTTLDPAQPNSAVST